MSWSVEFRKTRKNIFDHYVRASGKSNFQAAASIPGDIRLIYGSFKHTNKSQKV